jgi:hypothetical protein
MNLSWQFTYIDAIIILAIILIGVIVFYVRAIVRRTRGDQLDKKFIKEQWKKITELLDYGQEMNYKLAVIEADKLLDYVLKQHFFPGETMADRLRSAAFRFPEIKKVWWAHKVRNLVVHETRYTLKYGEAKKVLELFAKALKALGAL